MGILTHRYEKTILNDFKKGDDIMKNNIFDLTGQVALVAGGSSGLGL